jgi:hypothetical protein
MDANHPLFNFMPGPEGGQNVNEASTTALQQGELMLQEVCAAAIGLTTGTL